MATPVLYGPAFSTFTRSVRIALIEKGVDYTLEEINILGGIPAGYERRHPFKKVPAFEHDGLSLYETCAINRYVDEAFDGPALQPGTPAARARMTQAISVVDSYVYGPTIGTIVIQRAVVPLTGGTTDEAAVAAAVPAVRQGMGALEALLGNDAYLAGDAFSLADAHLAPVMGYFSQVPEGQTMMGELPNLSRWWQSVAARDSVKDTTPSLG